MTRQRRHFTPEQKVALLRLHLLEKKPVSDLCQEDDLAVNRFYAWQKQKRHAARQAALDGQPENATT